ncbi:MAG: phosphotransferase [Rickettsiales bacterium]|nr:phosphotransferase [Rickettsiales bacterium]
MKNCKDSFYYDAIHSVHPDVCGISNPLVRGASRHVLIANTPSGAFVFKFGTQAIAYRNQQIGQTLRNSDIPAPAPTAMKHETHHFEVYPYIVGKTLFQSHREGLDRRKVNRVYEQLINLTENMSAIDTNCLESVPHKYFHDIALVTTTKTSGLIAGGVVSAAMRLMNSGRQGLHHFGLTPKNILVDDAGDFLAILDLDEVAIGNENYMFGTMLEAYNRLGGQSAYLFDAYERITGRHLDRKRISGQVGVIAAGKKFLYKLSGMRAGRRR